MKEKIKKIGKWLLNNWARLAEIAVVIWAVDGIMSHYVSVSRKKWSLYGDGGGINVEYYIVPVMAYFLSAILILYLLRKYEKKA